MGPASMPWFTQFVPIENKNPNISKDYCRKELLQATVFKTRGKMKLVTRSAPDVRKIRYCFSISLLIVTPSRLRDWGNNKRIESPKDVM